MKKLIAILGFTFILIGCNKNNANHIPANYIGNWTGREGGFFGINVNSSGKVKINGDELRIGKSKFSIDQAPMLIDTVNNTYEMILDSIVYTR